MKKKRVWKPRLIANSGFVGPDLRAARRIELDARGAQEGLEDKAYAVDLASGRTNRLSEIVKETGLTEVTIRRVVRIYCRGGLKAVEATQLQPGDDSYSETFRSAGLDALLKKRRGGRRRRIPKIRPEILAELKEKLVTDGPLKAEVVLEWLVQTHKIRCSRSGLYLCLGRNGIELGNRRRT